MASSTLSDFPWHKLVCLLALNTTTIRLQHFFVNFNPLQSTCLASSSELLHNYSAPLGTLTDEKGTKLSLLSAETDVVSMTNLSHGVASISWEINFH